MAQKELKDWTEIEIKACIYDEQIKINIARNNIQALEQELQRRAQPQTSATA